MIANQRMVRRALLLATAIAIAACGDRANPTAPVSRPSIGRANAVTGVDKTAFDVAVSFEGPLLGLTCLDPNNPPLAHVNAVLHFSSITTPGGVTTTTSLFDIDRDNTWVIYNGLTYHIARGRPGKDDITHTVSGPGDLYIEAGLEPDFEVTDDPSQRLRLNFHWQIVIDPGGTVRVTKSTGACPPANFP